MSSPVSHLNRNPLSFLGLALVANIAFAQDTPLPMGPLKEVVQPIPAGASGFQPQGANGPAPATPLTQVTDSATAATILQWRALQQSDSLGFASYASFLLAHPGWPGEDRMRRLAETSINPASLAPVLVANFFNRYPPRTVAGLSRHAIALSALGRSAEAQAQARAAWRGGGLAPSEEAQLQSLFGNSFTSDDYAARADALLWQRKPDAAERILAWLPQDVRPVIEARIAMQRGAVDTAAKMVLADVAGARDPGYLIDKNGWLRDTSGAAAARELLARRSSLLRRPFQAERWLETLLAAARGAISEANPQLAYEIAAKVDDTYDPSIDISTRPFGERDAYTDLVWLAGTTALNQIDRARDAVGMFDRYANAARSPQTIAKGYYWAGRAALAANDTRLAQRYFNNAAAYPDQFHGQLALERLGRHVPAPAAVATPLPTLTDADRKAFAQRSVVRAAMALGMGGYWTEQSQFLRTIAANANSDMDRALAFDLSLQLKRPDLGVMVGRRTLANGASGYHDLSFPSVPVPQGYESNWTMIHAIARQESQFDRAAMSRVGARGLMQLMPGTAAETARKIGLPYQQSSLTEDPQYNIMLGSSYFQRMLSYYGGSYPLAVAAYNAGPGNVNRWIARIGDPRLPGTDIVQWIENIPISETRGYVQRVLENAVVYDTIRPETARFRGNPTPLSAYLGKNQPG